MALISCPECQKEISSNAESCINCGNPMESTQVGVDKERIHTIQETGKSLKVYKLISIISAVIGFIMLIKTSGENPSGIGALMFFGGVALYIITSFRVWWNHK